MITRLSHRRAARSRVAGTADSQDADVVVVGAGIGGLTTAAFLATAGRRVLVVERAHEPGGNATVFSRRGATFDVGLHYMGECGEGGIVRKILNAAGVTVEFRELDPEGFDVIRGPSGTLSLPRDWTQARKRLIELWPGYRSQLDQYFRLVGNLGESARSALHGAVTLSPPESVRGLTQVLRYRGVTASALFDQLGFPVELRAYLSAYNAYYGLPPSETPLVLHSAVCTHYRRGAYYPRGGAAAITRALVDRITSCGGEIRLGSEVEQIKVRGRRVEGIRYRDRKSGAVTVRAPVVVSNADYKRTFLDLLGPAQISAREFARAASLVPARPLYLVSMLIDRDLHDEGLGARNYMNVGEPDVEAQYRALDRGRMPDLTQVLLCSSNLKDPPARYAAPPGQSSVQLMAPVPALPQFWAVPAGPCAGVRYRRREGYLAAKQAVSDQMVEAAETLLPGLADSVVYRDDSSPLSQERFVRSAAGSPYGLRSVPEQFMLRRPLQVTRIGGLYLAGAGTTFGHGVVSAMASGVVAASMVLRTRVLSGGDS